MMEDLYRRLGLLPPPPPGAGVPTVRGGKWSNVQVAALLARLKGRPEAAA
jgi:hypothetical protein